MPRQFPAAGRTHVRQYETADNEISKGCEWWQWPGMQWEADKNWDCDRNDHETIEDDAAASKGRTGDKPLPL